MKKIFGFIGCGNMGGAIAEAVSKTDIYAQILLSDSFPDKAESLANKINGTPSNNDEISKTADVIFLGVKPQMLGDAISEIKDNVYGRDVIVISMAAGVEISKIEEFFHFPVAIIRIMPNTPVSVGEGMVLYCGNEQATEDKTELFKQAMQFSGKLDYLPEKLIDAASALSGCGPAFVYMFIEALADGGVACGLPRDKAQSYAVQTLLGSAKLVESTGKHPGELKDAVCSPGGSTIMGVKALENGCMRGTVINAISDAYNKTKQLGK